ncbi:MAG: phytanoyl-CoA dioxygenase family protein [Archangium sp.]
MNFIRDGAELHRGAADVHALEAVLGAMPPEAGRRLHGVPGLDALLSRSSLVAGRPVRAILFDKTRESNWSLGWHQDRVIAVKARVDTPGFGPWTMKNGLHHVAPPIELLSRMVTLRIHLDDVTDGNAPLRIAPGSHRLGRINDADVKSVVARCGTFTCLAKRGDIWAYATPILHASAASTSTSRRRVLQVDSSADELPGDLEWLGL